MDEWCAGFFIESDRNSHPCGNYTIVVARKIPKSILPAQPRKARNLRVSACPEHLIELFFTNHAMTANMTRNPYKERGNPRWGFVPATFIPRWSRDAGVAMLKRGGSSGGRIRKPHATGALISGHGGVIMESRAECPPPQRYGDQELSTA